MRIVKRQKGQVLSRRREWSIGICLGNSPFDFASPGNTSNPVLTCESVLDVSAGLVADPFMINVDGRWHMFFEALNGVAGKGEIGLATSEDGFRWRYQQIVLAEPFHLSYPYVFEWQGDYYMVPESYRAESVRLYRAVKFPWRWECVATLLSGGVFLDSSLVRYEKKWWLFAETNPAHNYDTLRLFYADDLRGPWTEHPKSPIVRRNAHIARPGGRVLVLHDTVVRYTQDCFPTYGLQIRAFVVTELGTTRYREKESEKNPVLTPQGSGWSGGGMHHIDDHLLGEGRWLACVDGWCYVDG